MLKAIVFDFDGVILESAEIKTEAFRALFSGYPEKVDEIVAYHRQHVGISRSKKIQHFYNNILKVGITESVLENLSQQFSQLVFDKVLQAKAVPGVIDFLERRSYLFFIASGTPEEELKEIVFQRGFNKFFRGIYGSPESKSSIVKKIMDDYCIEHTEIAYIGDAISDYEAARETGVLFVGRLNSESKELFQSYPYTINDFVRFDEKLKEWVGD